MKNNGFLFLIFLCSLQLIAQENITLESEVMDTRFYETDKIPVVKGKLLNYSPKKHKNLKLEYRLTSLEEWEIRKYATIQSSGQFELVLTKPYPYQEIFIYIEDYYQGTILANEDLHLALDLKQLKRRSFYHKKGVHLSGTDAGFNNYYSRFLNYQEKERAKYFKRYMAISMDSKSPNKIRREQYIENYKLWDKRVANYIQVYPSKYAALLEEENTTNFYASLLKFYLNEEIENDTLLEKAFNHQPRLLSHSGYFYYRNKTHLLKRFTPEITIQLLKKVLSEEVTAIEKQSKINPFLEQCQLKLIKKTYNKTIYEEGYALFSDVFADKMDTIRLDSFIRRCERFGNRRGDLLKLVGVPAEKWDYPAYYEKILPTLTTPWIISSTKEQLHKSIIFTEGINNTLATASTLTASSSLGKSLQSFPFGAKLYKSQVADAATLVAAIQNAFPNKSIILDVWTTWCGPCIYDMRNSAKTKKALKSLPVEIIYLGVEDYSNQKKWAQTIADLKLAGHHIFLKRDLAKSVMDFFNLKGYPSYIFINQAGNWDTNFIYSISNLKIHKLKKKL